MRRRTWSDSSELPEDPHELSTQSEICIRLGYGSEFSQVLDASEEVGRIINGLIASFQRERSDDSARRLAADR